MRNMRIAIILLIICGCAPGSTIRERDAASWIREHEKPIQCRKAGEWDSYLYYTLIDKNCEIYSTGLVKMNLPDTIK